MNNWIIVPYIDNWLMTQATLTDALDQDVETRVLAIAQSYTDATRRAAEALAAVEPRLINWFWDPMMPSLSGVWNRALDFVCSTGATDALVLNNDLRISPYTYQALKARLLGDNALFVSGIGVTQEQFEGSAPTVNDSKGGPDFSCFCISKECHEKFRFDEALTPCYCEDADLHRRVMLAGEGTRMYSIDLPYWHVDRGSGTLKSMTPERRAATEKAIFEGARAHYARKWGGGVNEERFFAPFGARGEDEDHDWREWEHFIRIWGESPRTPDLFAKVREQWNA